MEQTRKLINDMLLDPVRSEVESGKFDKCFDVRAHASSSTADCPDNLTHTDQCCPDQCVIATASSTEEVCGGIMKGYLQRAAQ